MAKAREITPEEKEKVLADLAKKHKKKERKENENEGKPGRLHMILSLALCAGAIFIAAMGYISPLISTQTETMRPADLMATRSIWDITITGFPTMYISYYVYKYYYYVHICILAATVFFLLLVFITRSKKMHRQISAIMYVVVILTLMSMLIGFNYVNVIHALNPTFEVSAGQAAFFILTILALFAKFGVDIVFGEKVLNEDMKGTNLGMLTSFTQSFITIISIFFPLYIFPGTWYRLRGVDILLGREDVLGFLPMATTYKFVLIGFVGVTAFCMAANMFLFMFSRRLFVHFNKFSSLISLLSIIVYSLMGVNYMLCYIDAAAYNVVFNTSMNTYSYIPLTLLALFWLGVGLSAITLSRVHVEYKVYAKPEDLIDENASKDEQGSQDGADDNTVLDPVPAFSELDKKINQYENDYQERMGHLFEEMTLPKLVEHVIEYAKYSRERLSYGPVEVKTFLAGLAASRLSILQGMSGTGKTSLPKIFMESIDGFCEIVAIESSWRDKNELLGYYNEFNKKYTPKTFTQYLYKASLNKEIPTLIVLDEMNLSRIEYYFSDFLSLMEAREHLRFIKLYDVQLYPRIDERKNYLALRDGHTIDIPTNVWFIGTANRDESTFEISDKVYDRAQTMNFDKRASKVIITEEKEIPKRFVPYSHLRKLFDESKSIAFDAEKFEVIQKVEKLLRPYKISFGNRVLKQIEEFVNAYVACSEITTPADRATFEHEAVDCILFSKVVRKLELKQITDIDTLIEEFEALKLNKSIEFLHSLRDTA